MVVMFGTVQWYAQLKGAYLREEKKWQALQQAMSALAQIRHDAGHENIRYKVQDSDISKESGLFRKVKPLNPVQEKLNPAQEIWPEVEIFQCVETEITGVFNIQIKLKGQKEYAYFFYK
jgi:hypothetical protein